jgi:YVTN family beta-propeller protein
MKVVYVLLLAICVLDMCSFDGCSVAPQKGTASGGFPVVTQTWTIDGDSGQVISEVGTPSIAVVGNWEVDDLGAAGSVKSFAVTTDSNGNAFVSNGRVYADWDSTVLWTPTCGTQSQQNAVFPDVAPDVGIEWVCEIFVYTESANTSTHFALPGAIPSTITAYSNFSNTYGQPGLRVYVGGSSPSLVSVMSATSTTPGSSAVFPFPTQSNGSQLAEGFYGLVPTNETSSGSVVAAGLPSYLALGGTTTLAGAYGVDAADIETYRTTCDAHGCTTTPTVISSAPILTEYYAGEVVSYTGATIPVGSEPVAIKAWGSYLGSVKKGLTTFYTHGPSGAVVANLGSSSVSMVSFSSNSVVANISVGAQPMAIALNSAGTMAYVASYGNGTLAAINLSNNTLSGTTTGLTGAQSVTMDPSGSYVWVGGTNYLYKVSVSTLAVAASYPVSGQVTSLAASNAQNELVYTLVEGCCSSSSAYSANEVAISTLTSKGTYNAASASPYAAHTMGGTLPSAATLPQATVVSAQFSNGFAASATPTGFVVYDLESHTQLMVGTTPTPVRGIASDPANMFAYFTVPDSNEYIAVPLESQ